MSLKVTLNNKAPARVDAAVVFLATGNKLGDSAGKLDKAHGGLLSLQLKNQTKFTGKAGQSLVLTPAKAGGPAKIILIGLGDAAKFDSLTFEAAGGRAYAVLSAAGAKDAVVYADETGKFEASEAAARVAMGVTLRSYRFDKYRTKDKDTIAALPKSITVITDSLTAAKKHYGALEAATEGVFLARDLANEPPNVLYPESFAKIIRDQLKPLGVEVEILDQKRLEKLGFGAHLAVGQGSARPPVAVVMRWPGTGKKGKTKPIAFVGKGVTFDTGGISIKPAGGMEDMKFDMCGAAAVVGLMKTLALRKSKAEVIGMVGLAENMPSHNAARPSDIVTTLSGQTVEILNTDAEGRLVLCDALTYVQKTYDPSFVINLATLTGAIVIALGSTYAGAFVNDDDLWANLQDASRHSGEKLWRMPLDEVYRKAMDSSVADLQNISTIGREAGSCTAAGYLERFIDEGRPWAHLDIAGVAWVKSDKPTSPKPVPGFGVLLLDRLVADHYE